LNPDGAIDQEHIQKVLGYKALKKQSDKEQLCNEWNKHKTYVRKWAAYKVKASIVEEAPKKISHLTSFKKNMLGNGPHIKSRLLLLKRHKRKITSFKKIQIKLKLKLTDY
jgi:hypothetical protein